MKKSILSLSLAFLGLGAFTTSCEDMLTPDMDRYATEFTGTDSINFYLGIMRNLQGVVEQNVLLGDLRSDLVVPTEYVTDSVNEVVNFTNLEDGESAILNRAAYYKVINQCNYYLAKVDSMAMKNNSYFMRRELAQVELIRAWTYMQLVQNYGKVPFITVPVNNAGTGWETNPKEGWADADNLLDMLNNVKGQSLTQAYAYTQAYGYPNYGNFNNGAVSDFAHKMMHFNADLVMGDLYLLRGASKKDYEQAAYHYHRYLDNDCNSYVVTEALVRKFQKGDEEPEYTHTTQWGNGIFFSNSWNAPSEIRTAIPSAANNFFGKVLTSIPQIYGFETNSGAHSTTGTNSSGEEVTTTSGQINVSANYKMRQLEPSAAFEALCRAQDVVYNDMNKTNSTEQVGVEYPVSLYDLRLDASAPKVATDIGRVRFIDKYCGTNSNSRDFVYPGAFTFRYAIPLYRTRQIYLKYAEAINRAGYPRHAFAILRDGLEPEKIPTIGTETERADTIFAKLGDEGFIMTDDTSFKQPKAVTLTYKVVADSAAFNNAGANCIDLNELYRAKDVEWLDFENFQNKKNVGVHQAGCGEFTNWDERYTYDVIVPKRIAEEQARSGQVLSEDYPYVASEAPVYGEAKTTNGDYNGAKYKYTVTENYKGYEIQGPSEAEIAAVETLIADEMALELAYEGTRYYDLMRIARHRNKAGLDGSAWMAWHISRRDSDLAPYESPATVGPLYNWLQDEQNWYLPAPKND